MRGRVEQTIDVAVPLRNAYDQWTQFEEFPRFMEGVEDVRQIDDRHCHWRTRVAGVRREFDTEIVDQLPDRRIAWRTTGGDVRQRGVVSFQPLDDAHTRVRLTMDVEPGGMAQKAAEAMGMLDRRVKGDLRSFKGFIEDRVDATGGWRGRIRPEDADTRESTGTEKGPEAMREPPGPVRSPGQTPAAPETGSWTLPSDDEPAEQGGEGKDDR